MDIEELLKTAVAYELSNHMDFIKQHIRPTINITLLNKAEASLGSSKLGGLADLPPTIAWPEHEYGAYCFIGQINFAEIPEHGNLFPKSGLLSLFYAYDAQERTFWQDPYYIKAIYTPADSVLATRAIPKQFEHFYSKQTLPIGFELGCDIPFGKEQVKDWPLDDYETDMYRELVWNEIHPSGAYLLGYPSYNTLCYDPTPDQGDFISLITLPSFRELAWCWHDGDKLLVFIEKEKLKQQDFSKLASDAG